MSSKTGLYNVEELAKQKRLQEKEIKVPPKANFLAAARHITSLFEGKKLNYGVMGGLEMLCLGYRREMPDLQIAYDDRDFHRIRAKLDSDQRVRLPEGMNSLFPARILIRTGPAYKDEGCTQAAEIEVDLVPPGSHGTPQSGSLSSNLVVLSLKNDSKVKNFKGLNMLHLVMSLVCYCRVRNLAWDPRKDILFLCQHYGEEIHSIYSRLDQKAIQQNFLGTPFFSRLSTDDQRQCYQVLLGTEPPPTMAITPPLECSGHKHSVSASELTIRPAISSHKSSPSLNLQQSPGLLSPPIPGNSKASHKRASSADHHSSKSLSSSQVPSGVTLELSSGNRDSRSRYRPISTSHSQGNQPDSIIHPMKNAKPSPPHAGASVIQAPHNMQGTSHQRLYPSSHLNLGNMVRQNHKSMPNLNAGSSGPVRPYAFAQTPSLNGLTGFPQSTQAYVPPVEMSATPAPINPGQQYMKSQLGLGEVSLPGKHAVNNFPITERPMPPQARNSQRELQPPTAEPLGQYKPQSHMKPFYQDNRDTDSTKLQRVSEIELPSTEAHSIDSGAQSLLPHETNRAQAVAAVELDTENQIGQFIAELSAERATPAPEQRCTEYASQHSPMQRQSMLSSAPAAQDSPISPPDSYVKTVLPDLQPENVAPRPLHPRTPSAPLDALPMSLMAGGPAHHRLPSQGIKHPAAPASKQAAVLTTNALRYTRYYASQTPPSSLPNSAQASPQAAPSSTYKAYQPPSMALSPPTMPVPVADVQREGEDDEDDDDDDDENGRERMSRPRSFSKLRDVDGAQGYFRSHARHRREASHDSHTSNASHDSSKLALEYQAELPGYGAGYEAGSKA